MLSLILLVVTLFQSPVAIFDGQPDATLSPVSILD